MNFIERSRDIVKDYLGSVAFIDDRIFNNQSLDIPSGHVKKPERLAIKDPNTNGTDGSVDDRSEESNIDAKELTTAFAINGMHCALCQYNDDSLIGDFKKLLAKSDVSIVDWQLKKGDSEIAKDIIKTLLEKDKKASPSLRMIVIYTSYNHIQDIIPDHISKIVDTLYPELNPVVKEYSLIVGHTKIVVLDKKDVGESELPGAIVKEFTDLTAGIISNATLKSISLLKRKCHNLLGILNKDIDPGLLAHKSLLPNPDDFSTYVQELIKSEVGSLIESDEVSKTLTDEMLEKWIEANFNTNEATISIRETKYKLENRIAYSILEKGIEEDNVLKAILDTQSKNKALSKRERKNIGKEMSKVIHNEMTSVFNPNGQKAEDIDYTISHINSFKHNIALGLRPKLGFGTVIKDSSSNYWLCMQPKCDCVRLRGDSNFFFLQLRIAKNSGSFDLVMKDGEEFIKLIVSYKVVKSKQLNFPVSPNMDIVLVSENNDGEYILTDTNQNNFKWCGELKTEYAQRISNNFSAQLSRVGMEEYEWLRRS